ncbi:PhoX family protein [Embleya sp. NPDC127516]|uniref:PhoX family protein n=1 Tax=Embleya sp. NPDC127516 TaxID=3363990 RepID=UPI00380B25BC
MSAEFASGSRPAPTRRTLVVGAIASAAWIHTAAPAVAVPQAAGSAGTVPSPADSPDAVVVDPRYTAEAIAPWGAAIPAGNQSRPERVGTHHSGLHFQPTGMGRDGEERGLLMIGHEYVGGVETALGRSGRPLIKADLEEMLAAVGVTIVAVRKDGDGSRTTTAPANRRITGVTPTAFSGPVGSDRPELRTSLPAMGVLAASFHGTTPWGTVLACEENFNRFFGTDDPAWSPDENERRYGLDAFGYGHCWHRADDRFDVSASPREPNRYGWVVEIDPADEKSLPVKRTALGRFGHAGATVTEAHGRVVAYSGDDEDGGYLYKFVGDRPWRTHVRSGRSPLDHGTLLVARFDEDGSGHWLPLIHGSGPLIRRNGWRDQADVLLRTRQAADAVRATPLGRPQQVALHPRLGDGFLALADVASVKGCHASSCATPAMALGPGADTGRILQWHEIGSDPAVRSFRWRFAAMGDDGRGRAGVPAATLGSPRGLRFDRVGRLWITTGGVFGGHEDSAASALLAADPESGTVVRVATAPHGARFNGVSGTPDGRTVFVNVRHADRPDSRERSATIAVSRRDGAVISPI